MYKRVFSVWLLLGMVSFGFSQAVGKLSGVVKDKTTGEPLPGVNVVLQETFLGASTDVDGFYVILNVPAGTYTVSFSYIGYKPVEVTNVRVVTDITKRLDLEMEPTTIELDQAIVVVAERPFFEVGATNTVRVLDSQDIERIPIKGVNSIVAVNAGVVKQDGSGGETDNATINVRGGRGNETLLVVDGVPYNDLLFGNAAGTIPDNAIEQISSQLGGFSAKYGSAQSGVINVITKSGGVKYSGGLEGISSQVTDDYGYNSFNGSLSGPLWPGNRTLSFFGIYEYVDTDDDNPRAIDLVIPATTYRSGNFERQFPAVNSPTLPNNESIVRRFTGKIDASLFEKFKLTLSTGGSFRDARDYIATYAKNNSYHNPRIDEDVVSGSLKISNVLNETTFWDATVRYKFLRNYTGDGVWFDNLDAYGDTLANQQRFPHIDFFRTRTSPITGQTVRPIQGSRQTQDNIGVYFDEGRVSNLFRKYTIETMGGDFNFTKQIAKHLVEFGGTLERNTVRYYNISPAVLAIGLRDNPLTPQNEQQSTLRRYLRADPIFYGYDIFGNEIDNTSYLTTEGGEPIEQAAPPQPIIAALYLQDKIEFQDFILNLGVRWDYYNPDFHRFRDPFNLFGAGDPSKLDPEDLEDAPAENYLSPRLGFAFPVSQYTVFHAQYGIFRQAPRLLDVYTAWSYFDDLLSDDNFQVNNGYLQSESTTQYEFGFNQQFGNVASLDITAYYKNVKGLTNVIRKEFLRGQDTLVYLSANNTDFGTIKGLALSFNLRRLGPFSTKIDYTLALSEGTGSSQSSSFTAAFRNTNGETPKTIAPLDFDQRHTLTAILDVRAGKGEGPAIGGLRILENSGANFVISYNSGRPYTPLAFESVLPGAASNQGDVTQFINSATAPSNFRIDLKLDKQINVGRMAFIPYLWVQNLLDRKNVIDVYQSTGEPDNTNWLNTTEGQQILNGLSEENRQAFISDYRSLERNPVNYGIPRLIRLGLKMKF